MLCEHGDVTGAVTTLLKLGELAVAADTFAVAVTVVERLAALPASGPAGPRLADLLRFAGREDLAVQLAQAVLRRDPADISAALAGATMSRLAIGHGSQTEIDERREEYTRDLQRLAAASGTASEAALTAAAPQVGNTKPSFLAYRGENDRTLQEIYGRVLTRIAAASGESPTLSPPPIDGRLRIGFASAYFHLHSVSKLFGGWMTSLDPSDSRCSVTNSALPPTQPVRRWQPLARNTLGMRRPKGAGENGSPPTGCTY